MRAPEDCRDMTELRKEIDRIDEHLVKLLAERMTYVKRAVKIKHAEKLPAFIPERVQAVVNRVKEKAAQENLDPVLAEKIWNIIIDWAVNFETEKLDK